ncbi:MAG: ABC transporter ATP-binding protein [Acidobacteriota bacterium]|nr:ABC transporter ATP-binding protein [Acidobacteriota bacterium]
MLCASSISYAYGDAEVLHDIDLRVEVGNLVGILGPNGSGKTTLLKLLAGLLTPTHGHVTLDGIEVTRCARQEVAKRLAMVPQATELAFDYTAFDIVLMGRYPHLQAFELEGPSDINIVRRMLTLTGTSHLEDRTFRTLSGGEKQRVVLASALAQFDSGSSGTAEPTTNRVLLLDEPTSSLDLAFQLATAELLGRLNESQATTVVLCTHDLNLAAGLCRELVLLRDGKLVAAGEPAAVLTPETVGAVFDVDVDIRCHPANGRVSVIPVARRARPS